MAISCPYCGHVMALKGAKPGRFQPRCPQCQEKFVLVIPEDRSVAPSVKRIAHGHEHGETLTPEVATALGIAAPPPAPKPNSFQRPVLRAPHVAQSAAHTMPPQAAATSSVSVPLGTDPRVEMHGSGAPSARSLRASASAVGATSISEPIKAASPPRPIDSGSRSSVANDKPPAENAEEVTRMTNADDLRGRLGGYEIVQRLGAGGMGAVYLARQMSLDRNVALKVLAPQLAGDASFVARFTREAYAAAQLTHHNVVQIYDIGQDRDVNFFSMEFVDGQTLSNLVRASGKVDPDAAVGLVLQAARGLKFAHDHGLIHRDIKPDNLLLNDQGILKVADLGLVKRAGVEETRIPAGPRTFGDDSVEGTQFNISMGTPAYMPPEQAEDAAHVDQRADIYSLGCTLYDLLTGHPPFEGKTAMEVITKHQREQIVPPDRLVKNVPRHLSDILLKMVAKRPEQRYQEMGEVIKALEDFLGVETGPSGAFTPKEEHAKILEIAVAAYNASGWGVLRSQLILAFYVLCAIGFGALLWSGHYMLGGGLLGFAVLTFVVYQITQGVLQKTTLFYKARQLVFGARLIDWLMAAAVGALAVMVLYVSRQIGPWIGGGVLAVLAAQGFYWGIDVLVAKDRRAHTERVEKLLRQMRLRGLDEDSIHKFVCKYGGDRWEAFYEEMFGYDDKLRARELWGKGEKGRDRKRHAAWRDAAIRWMEARLKARKDSRERKLLAKIEARALAAKGIDGKLARKQARKAADKMVLKAEMLRLTALRHAALASAPLPAPPPSLKGTIGPTMLPPKARATPRTVVASSAGALLDSPDGKPEDEFHRDHETYFKRRFGGPLDLLFGGQLRFFLAILILAGFALWWNQKGQSVLTQAVDVAGRQREINIVGSGKQVTDQIVNASKQIVGDAAKIDVDASHLKPLEHPWLPARLGEALSSYNALAAGLLLLLSAFLNGRLMAMMTFAGCAIAMAGHAEWAGVPLVVGRAWLAAAVGGALVIFGMIFFRETEGY